MISFRKNHDDTHTLSDNYVGSLAEDNHGRLWVGTMGGGLNVIDKKRENIIRIKELSSSDIRDLAFSRSTQKLWIATSAGLFVLDTETPQLTSSFENLNSPLDLRLERPDILLPDGVPFQGTASGVILDGDQVWVSTRNSGVLHFNHKSQKAVWFTKGTLGLEDNTFNTIFLDKDGGIWLGSQNRGLVEVRRGEKTIQFIHYHTQNSLLPADDVMAVADAAGEKLWVGTWNGGLALFDKNTGEINSYTFQQDPQFSLPSNIILDVIRAENGQIWLGTFDKGVSWFHPDSPFHTYRKTSLVENGLAGNIIWSFAAESEESLWIGTNKGLSKIDLTTNKYITPDTVTPKDLWEKIRNDDIRALHVEGEALWIAARKQGVFRLSLDNGDLTPLANIAGSDQKLTHSYIRLIYQDAHKRLWMGTSKGLNRLDLSTGKILNYTVDEQDELSLPHYRLRALFEDSSGRMWAGTSYGLLLFDPDGNPLKVFKPGKDVKSGLELAGNGVRGIGEDHLSRLWLATEGGLSIYDPVEKQTIILREKHGLPSNATYCALWNDGFMWVTTLNGLARVDAETLHVETYTTIDGLPDNEFNFNAWHKLSDSRLALGTLSGFTVFSTDKVPGPEQSETPPPLYLKAYKHQNDVRWPVDLEDDDFVAIDWHSNKISFAYGALHYRKPGSVTYEYKLAGVSDAWTATDNPRFVTFSGLPAGDYSFFIKAKDKHGLWSVESEPIHFTISKAPWKTNLAYFVYFFLFCLVLVYSFLQYSKALRNRSMYLEKIVAERTGELESANCKLQEKHLQLDQLISSRERLFRAIAHELRTPLTVIKSSLQQLVEEEGAKPILQTIYNRADRMGSLINNILDLTVSKSDKIDRSHPFLVKTALEETLSNFSVKIQQQKKVLEKCIDIEREYLTMNRDVFILIVSNLLSNACKFTDINGKITIKCSCRDEVITLRIEDDGRGVSEGDEERIFDWFERARSSSDIEGWGIGLAFVKDEIEAIGGTIELVQDGRQGATFIATFPVAPIDPDNIPLLDENLTGVPGEGRAPVPDKLEKSYSILIIEDDRDLRSHLTTLFPANWKKLTAADAETGADLAIQEEPDIIITDLMLPGESGFDVTKKLKDNPATSHIPIIILTALENEKNRLIGLGLSVDSFLGKPFNNQELLLRVNSLLSNREKMLVHAKQVILNMFPSSEGQGRESLPRKEDDFLESLNSKLGGDQAVSLMSLDEAANKMAMSKRSLQREMEQVGISWREYKRFRKIRFAMGLLVDKEKQIGDIAVATGYSSAAHFSKIFKEMTGQSPSEWRRSQLEKSA